MNGATRDEAARIFFHVTGDPGVDFRSEAHHFRSHVIDKHRAPDLLRVQVVQERARRTAAFENVLVGAAGALHDFKRGGLEHLDRLDVDVAVGDQKQLSVIGSQFPENTAEYQHRWLLRTENQETED
jgi:hypothetical protein